MLGETIVEPSAWPRVMDAICKAVGAPGAVLLQADVRTLDVPRTNSVDELASRYFAGGWQTRDIRAERGVPLVMRGTKAFIDEDILSLEELEASAFVNECTLPTGFKWAAVVGFSAGSAMWGLCLQRTPRQQPFSRSEARLLATLSDRLSEVATLASAIGRVALANAVNALESIGKPAVAVDRFGLVLGANRLAESLFGNDVRVKDRRLVVSDAHAAASLQRLAGRLLAAPETEPLLEPPIVVRARNSRTILIDVLPVHPAARNPFLGARALLTFSDLSRGRTFDSRRIAVVFGLTPAEARLAAALAEGRSLESIAEANGVSLTTARNQLKSVFSKTDTHRQSELVAFLAKL